MNSLFAMAMILSTTAMAQTMPDPAVKTSNGKTTQHKKPAPSSCAGMQGGVDVSGAESIEMQTKSNQANANNSAACGKHNGKAATPQAAPNTPNPDVNRPVTQSQGAKHE